MAGAILVVIGVTGELYVEFARSSLEASLRQIDSAIVADMGKQSADANERAGELEKESETIRAASIESARQLEAERLRRVQLQHSILHRMIPSYCVADKCNFDILKPFTGMKLLVEYAGGDREEPRMFVSNVATFPVNSGWDVPERSDWLKSTKRTIPDGVTIEAYIGPQGETDASALAADAFAEFLRASGIDGVRRSLPPKGELSPNTVRLLIGFMPDPFRLTPRQ